MLRSPVYKDEEEFNLSLPMRLACQLNIVSRRKVEPACEVGRSNRSGDNIGICFSKVEIDGGECVADARRKFSVNIIFSEGVFNKRIGSRGLTQKPRSGQ
jgi:hypothetical protein